MINFGQLRVVSLWLVAAASLLYADNLTTKDYADKYFNEFNTWQSDMPVYHINREVPVAMQVDVLDEIFDRACSAQPQKQSIAIHQVLSYIENCHPEFTPSERFDANLYALIKDQNYTTRRDVIEFLGRMKRDKDHDLIIAAMNDPNDVVRGAAINAFRDRPDAEATFQKFIQDHESDTNYTTSVQYAKSGLEALHEKANGS